MSVVILKFYSSDPKRSFLYSFYPRYLLFLSCNAAVTIHALSMLYRRFIHALYDLQLKEINFIKNPSIPFYIIHSNSSFPNPPLCVWKGYYTCSIQRMDPIMLFSFTSLRFVARPMRDTMRRFRAISPYFLVQITQFLLLPKRTHTIFHYRSNSLLRVATQ